MLAARNIARRFGPLLALNNVDFDARPGEIAALLGENGAGKTTLMNILAGRLRPDAGSIELFGRALRPGSPAAALAAGIAAVHQSPMLFERFSWEENLALGGFGRDGGGLGLKRVDLAAVVSKARDLARHLGFELPPPGAIIADRSVAERVRLEVLRALSFDPRVLILDGISLRLGAGEIAGVAGVDGNGQVELVEVLAGARPATSGTFHILGNIDSAALAVIPQDRDLDGLILDMQLWENLLLAEPVRARMTRHGWLDVPRALELCREALSAFHIRAAGPDALASSLSGGNRQRLEVARALTQNPRVIVAHNVTRGLDLSATADVHRILLEFAAKGGAVLLISSDLDELLAIASRLFVVSRGKIRATGPNERSSEKLGLLMAGRWSD